MAKRVASRRALRDQNDAAEPADDETEDDEAEPEVKVKKTRTRKATTAKPAKAKTAAKPRVRKKATKVPARMFARWAVCDNGMKRIAIFEYKDRAGADAKLADMQERKSGTFFLQLIKEAYVPPPDAIVPA